MKLSSLLVVWLVISVLASIPLEFVSWGDPGRIHGQGFPLPTVIWDRQDGSGPTVDFLNPLAFVLNPLLIFVVGTILILSGYGGRRLVRRRIR